MAYLIGTDEAGYGPNLGPLVISASVWDLPEGTHVQDLYGLLEHVIAAKSNQASGDGRGRVWMADSKLLYRSGKGLKQLEHGLLAALAILGRQPTNWHELWQSLAPDAMTARDAIPWYRGYDTAIPRQADPAEIRQAAATLRSGLAHAGVRLVDLRCRVIFEGEFNRLVAAYGNKAEALSRASLCLAADLCRLLPSGPVLIVCDKHGGRDHYAHLLLEHFAGSLVEVCGETRRWSAYRLGQPKRRIEVCFQAKAESYLPAALASMAAKYLRELAMEALNAFWGQHVPGLRRTAGYPQDARRFKAEIASAQAALGLEDEIVWRSR